MATMGLDLRDELTVFCITVGDEPNYRDCMAHLAAQDCAFRLDVIDREAPMNAAFQAMLDRCTTPYFVQVDEDMLLRPDAVRLLYEDIRDAMSDVAIVARPLWDEWDSQGIIGVKVYRHAVVRRYPYRASFSCEMDQVTRFRADGFKVESRGTLKRGDCVGRHGAHYDARSIFDRYRNMMQRLRAYSWVGWTAKLPRGYLNRWMAEPENELRRWAFLGCIAGLVGPMDELKGPDKDFRRYRAEPAWRRLSGVLSEGPRELNIYATSTCNAKCPFCDRQLGAPPTAPDISPGMLSAVLDAHPTIKSACIAGFGEPLLHPQLGGLVGVLRQRGIAASLITNGLLLEAKAGDVARFNLARVSVSLNSGHPAVHADRMGVPGAFGKVVAGLRLLRETKEPGTKLSISAIVTRHTYPVWLLLTLAGELDIEEVHLLNTLPHAGVTPSFEAAVLRRGRDEGVLTELRQHDQARRVTVWPTLIGPPEECPRTCESAWVSMGIDGHGSISGCRRCVGPRKEHGGALSPDIWRGPHYFTLRSQVAGDRPQERAVYITPPAGPTPEQCSACFGNWSA